MDILNVRRLTPGIKALLVLAFAVMSGFMWRVRGTHGWGSMWGMFAVGVMLVLFIFAFFGNRKKMSLEAIPVAVILLGITNGGWGTLNSQMGGYLGSTVPFTGQEEEVLISISPWSGFAVMLLLGFGWMPLFTMFIGTLFSKKQYKIWHYIVFIAAFYGVVYLFQFVIAHFILPFISPEAVSAFKEGLADREIEMSPMMAYIKNLGSEAWFKKIPFGRNYFASIRVVSYSAGALVLSLLTLIFKRDTVTGLLSFVFNLISAAAITVADFVMISDSDAGFLANVNIPKFIEAGGWNLWEYLTGFFIGFGMMLVLVCLPRSVTGGEGYFIYTLPVKNKKLYAAYGTVFTLFFTFVVTVARPAGMRISEVAQAVARYAANRINGESGIKNVLISFSEFSEDILAYIFIALICIIGIIPCAVIAHKNAVKKDLSNLLNVRTEDFCLKAVPVYFIVSAVNYFFLTDTGIYTDLIFKLKAKGPSSFLGMLKSGEITVVTVMMVSFVLFLALYFIVSKKAVKKK